MAMVRSRIEDYTTASQMVCMEQVILKEVEETRARTNEMKFYNQIAARKMQILNNSGSNTRSSKLKSMRPAA
jgi:hypothetical protein